MFFGFALVFLSHCVEAGPVKVSTSGKFKNVRRLSGKGEQQLSVERQYPVILTTNCAYPNQHCNSWELRKICCFNYLCQNSKCVQNQVCSAKHQSCSSRPCCTGLSCNTAKLCIVPAICRTEHQQCGPGKPECCDELKCRGGVCRPPTCSEQGEACGALGCCSALHCKYGKCSPYQSCTPTYHPCGGGKPSCCPQLGAFTICEQGICLPKKYFF